MRFSLIRRILSTLVVVIALSMLVPLAIAVGCGESTVAGWISTIVLGMVLAAGLRGRRPVAEELGIREGFGLATFGWLLCVVYGAVPYVSTGVLGSYVDAFFETMSGFTTTGASVIADVESLPRSVVFWRSLTHYFGGMGILVLSTAILPLIGVGGMQLFRAEAPGPYTERLTPRMTETAKILWGIYLLFTVAEILLLWLGPLSFFDAVCHTFGTMATGGFSTRNASVGAYESLYVEIVVGCFMLLAGINFNLHYRALRGDLRAYPRNGEWGLFVSVGTGATLLIALDLWLHMGWEAGKALRGSTFQVLSITSTTGFATEDFDQWPHFSKTILLCLMLVGGCAGSTGGGMKHLRLLILLRHTALEFRRLLYPQAILQLRVRGEVVPRETVFNVLGFFLLFIATFVVGSLAMALLENDWSTAVSSVAATLGNIGPGFGGVGPAQTYEQLSTPSKLLLSLLMLLGRLELFTVLILFSPHFWKR